MVAAALPCRGERVSWRAAKLIALVRKVIAVLGCGAVGLATARLLQERGCAVTIYAKDLPPNTTSNIAGAQWFPVFVFQRSQQTPEFMARFVEASHIANRRYQIMVGARYGIRWLPNYRMGQDPIPNEACSASTARFAT